MEGKFVVNRRGEDPEEDDSLYTDSVLRYLGGVLN